MGSIEAYRSACCIIEGVRGHVTETASAFSQEASDVLTIRLARSKLPAWYGASYQYQPKVRPPVESELKLLHAQGSRAEF